jgi:nicotinamidase-related amidase
MVRFEIDPSRMTLLVHDMQKAFIGHIPSFPAECRSIIANLQRLIAAFRAKGRPIVYSQVVMRRDFADWRLVTAVFPRAALEEVAEGSPGIGICDDLAPAQNDIVIRKSAYSPFQNTNLENILRAVDTDALVVAGVTTNVGCDSTIRDAFYCGIKTLLVIDASGTDGIAETPWGPIPAEQMHRATCATLGQYFAELITTEQVLARLK